MQVDTASTLFSLERELASDLGRAGMVANNWLNCAPVYISTKSTGSGKFAQIIEIAVLAADQSVLFHSQLLPSVCIDSEAELSHGLNLSALQGRPRWSQVIEKLKAVIAKRNVIMFDAIYQTRLLKQSCLAFNLSFDWLDELSINCAMYLAANAYGTDNRYGTVSIQYAMQRAKVKGYTDAGPAVAGCYALIQMLQLTAGYSLEIKQRLDLIGYKISA